ncbi:MAG TPA: ATP-dependent DNA ligase, partial [Terriglobales bacterium]
MNLPVNPPVLPMLAKRVAELPEGDDWVFEPKWDGFRALVFRDGDEIFIQSRDEKPLNRYFPELEAPLRSVLLPKCVLDGEIVIVKNNELDFDLLQLRLHPAASRVKLLSQQTPAS